MHRTIFVMIACLTLVLSMGCRNRCQQCNGGLFAGNATIPSPATYSLNIPNGAQNSPYYVPGQGNSISHTAAAPTPAVAPANLNGWVPIANPNGALNRQPGSVNTTLASNPTGLRVASSTAAPATGHSFQDSVNYQSTVIDERRDLTRLPVTDASTVRAPARSFNRFARLPQPTAPRYPATFNVVTSTGQPVFVGNPVVPGQTYAGQPFHVGQPVLAPQRFTGNVIVNQPNQVLAQSTTDSGSRTQLGWRDREIGSGRGSLNR